PDAVAGERAAVGVRGPLVAAAVVHGGAKHPERKLQPPWLRGATPQADRRELPGMSAPAVGLAARPAAVLADAVAASVEAEMNAGQGGRRGRLPARDLELEVGGGEGRGREAGQRQVEPLDPEVLGTGVVAGRTVGGVLDREAAVAR